ncbi:MAG: patatin-like phospholipase family protein [Rikenellaceae bacterium]
MRGYLLTIFLTLFASLPTLHASTEPTEPKSVGVVMSGGGAKGLYHIGVLEALEESGVAIDYVAGTSMGAIIAGLYASGYSPDEMRQLALSGDLERWVSGRIDANYGSLFRRGSTLRSGDPALALRINTTSRKALGEEIDKRDEIGSVIGRKESGQTGKKRLPESLIPTTQIDMAISELYTPASVASGGDFSKLMVPFLCVASDVANGEKVVMTEGDLGESIRASMAIPIAFKPIVRETGEILYDGGIQDNFPWRDMVERLNPDVIIGSVCGVDAGEGVDTWASSDNLSLIDQLFLLSMNKSSYDLPENGVKIAQNAPVGMLDFANPAKVMNLGYWDTKQQMSEISALLGEGSERLPQEFYNERRKAFKERSPELIFDSYDITGLNSHQEEYVKRYISTTNRQQRFGAAEQREMSFPELKKSLYSVLTTGDYTTEYPVTSYNAESERYNFSIGLENKPSLELSLGGNLSSTPFNQLYIGARYSTIERISRTLFSELYLGPIYNTGRFGYRVDFYHIAPIFIDSYFNFAVKNLSHGNFGKLSEATNTMGVTSSDYLMSVGIGAPIKRRSQIILRGNGGVQRYDYQAADFERFGDNKYLFNKSRLKYIAGKAEIERSTIDNLQLPTNGSLLSLSGIGVVGTERSYADEYEVTSLGMTVPTERVREFTDRMIWFGMKFNFIHYFNLAAQSRVTLGIDLDATYTTIPKMYSSMGRQLVMPAYQPISHMQMVYMPEYSAPRYMGVGVIPSVRLWRDLSLRLEGYAFGRDNLDDESSTIERNSTMEFEYIMQGSFVYATRLGPLSLAVTKYGIESWQNCYLTFNFGSTIFAPKGTFY